MQQRRRARAQSPPLPQPTPPLAPPRAPLARTRVNQLTASPSLPHPNASCVLTNYIQTRATQHVVVVVYPLTSPTLESRIIRATSRLVDVGERSALRA